MDGIVERKILKNGKINRTTTKRCIDFEKKKGIYEKEVANKKIIYVIFSFY